MTDNVSVTAGSGTTIATDNIGGVNYQRVKVTWGADGTANDADVASGSPLPIQIRASGGTELATSTNPVRVDPTGTTAQPITDNGGSLTVDNGGTFAVQAAQSGTWNVTNISGTVSLPTGAATAAKQPALGTAGAASADVITVQGVASMTALKVDGSAVTQPVSGTVTVQQSTASSLKVDLSGTAANTTAIKVDNSGVTQPVSGTVTSNQGGTWTVQPGNTANTTAWLVSETPATSGGLSIYRLLSASSTNGNNIKASAGQVYGWAITNTNASARFVKLYNKATSPTVGTDTPVMTLVIPGNSTGSGMVANFASGIAFGTGIGIAVTGVVTDADTTAISANEVVVNLFYK